MPLLDDIKQTKPFRTVYQEIVVNILFTNNWVLNQQLQMFKKYDLSSQQYNVLRILRGRNPEPMTVNEIIERMLDKMSNASRLVDKLLEKGLVNRIQKPSDRRACEVTITEKGLEILNKIDEIQHEWEQNFTNLTEDEAKQLSNLLDKLRNS